MYPEKACEPCSFHQHHPISSHLVSCQPKHPSMLFFVFQLICSTPPSKCARMTRPKLNRLFVMASCLPCECSKLLAKTNATKNAVVHSIISPHLPKVLSSWYIKVVPLPRRRSEQKNAIFFSKDGYLQAAQKNVKSVLNIYCSDDETQPRRQLGNDRKHNDIISKGVAMPRSMSPGKATPTIDEEY